MKIELPEISLSNKGTIKSVELVDIINTFRKLESESTGKEYKKLSHYDFCKKIAKENKILKSLKLGEQNILPSSYINSQNKEQPCYELTAKGMRMMLNAESTLVRYKTEEYIENLENEIIELQEENRKLELEAKDKTILRLESANSKISKILQADNYISNEMYGEPTYITSIVINILKKCSAKKNILKYEDDIYFIKSEPVKEEFMKYRIKPAEFKRYVEYFGGCQTRIKCKVKGGEYNIAIGCYAIPGFIIDWDMKDSVERLSY